MATGGSYDRPVSDRGGVPQEFPSLGLSFRLSHDQVGWAIGVAGRQSTKISAEQAIELGDRLGVGDEVRRVIRARARWSEERLEIERSSAVETFERRMRDVSRMTQEAAEARALADWLVPVVVLGDEQPKPC